MTFKIFLVQLILLLLILPLNLLSNCIYLFAKTNNLFLLKLYHLINIITNKEAYELYMLLGKILKK